MRVALALFVYVLPIAPAPIRSGGECIVASPDGSNRAAIQRWRPVLAVTAISAVTEMIGQEIVRNGSAVWLATQIHNKPYVHAKEQPRWQCGH